MTAQAVWELAGIPFVLFLVCVYFGLKLVILQDITAIRSKEKPPVRDEKNYVKWAGGLILYFGIASFVMGLLALVNVYAAVIEIVVCIVVMGVLWRRMNKKYGA